MTLSLIVVSLLTLLHLLLTLYLIYSFFRVFIKKDAPFVPSGKLLAPFLTKEIILTDSDVVYDLGAGDGRVLRALHSAYPRAKFIGIERDPFALFLARIKNRNIKPKALCVRKGDFFKEDLSGATCIVTYLFPEVMDQLLPKLERELPAGTRLFSIDFEFSQKDPMRIVTLPPLPRTICKRIIEYRF